MSHDNASDSRPGAVSEIDQLLDSALAAAEKGGALDDGWFSAISMLTVDAALAADREALRLAREGLYDLAATLTPSPGDPRQLAAGRLTALAEVAESALFRAAPVFAATELEPDSWAHQMLSHIAENSGCTNTDVIRALGHADATEVSRSGRKLLELGVAVRRRLGRVNRWSMTPRGTSVLAAVAASTKRPAQPEMLTLPAAEATKVTFDGTDGTAASSPAPIVMRGFLDAEPEPQSIPDLTAETGLDPKTVAHVIDQLADADYIVQGHSDSDDPHTEARWHISDRCKAIGVTVLAQQAVAVLTTLQANDVSKTYTVDLANTSPATVVSGIAQLVERIVTECLPDPSNLIGVGVNLPGHVDGLAGTVVYSPVLRDGTEFWRDVDLAERVREATGLPIVIENDVNALAIHEQVFGSARGLRNVSVVYIARDGGVGSGLIVGNRLIHGTQWAAGELGHLPVCGNERTCRCGRQGCLETLVYPSTISAMITAAGGPVTTTLQAAAQVATVESAAGDLDGPAHKAFKAAGSAFGLGLATVANLLNPQKLIVSAPVELLHKDAYASARQFDDAMQESLRAHAFSPLPDGAIDRRYLVDSYAARGAAAVLLTRTVFARPADVPREAIDAVPWTNGQSVSAPPTRDQADPSTTAHRPGWASHI